MNLQGVWMGSTRIQSQRRVTSCDLSTRKEKGQNSPLGLDPTLSSCLNEFAVAPECTFLTMLHDEDFFCPADSQSRLRAISCDEA